MQACELAPARGEWRRIPSCEVCVMRITVKLFATLRTGRFIEQVREYPAGTTVGQIITDLNIREEEAALVFIDGRHAETGRILSDEETLAFFPPIGGG
jgi:molybdopterin synthase sulfur carrier subunit